MEPEQSWNRLRDLFKKISSINSESEIKELKKFYSEESRAYHTLNHVITCLKDFDLIKSLLVNPEEVEIAIWYHDAIYNSRLQDNEEKSVILATKHLTALGANSQLINSVQRLILITKHIDFPVRVDEKYLVDIDLSIFGKSQEEFIEYEKNVAKEYNWRTALEAKQKREALYNKFLQRSSIYLTNFFKNNYETLARANLRNALVRLKN